MFWRFNVVDGVIEASKERTRERKEAQRALQAQIKANRKELVKFGIDPRSIRSFNQLSRLLEHVRGKRDFSLKNIIPKSVPSKKSLKNQSGKWVISMRSSLRL